jgi:phosphatidylglycerophosphate synthase
VVARRGYQRRRSHRQAAPAAFAREAGGWAGLPAVEPAKLRPSPDLVSAIALLLAIVAAAVLAKGAGVVGGVLVHLASVVDGMDGEVARLQLRARPLGAFLDGLADRLGDAAIVAGLGLWALEGSDPSTVVWVTAAALTGSILSMASKDRIRGLGLPRPVERGPFYALAGRDGRLLLVTVGALLGRPLLALGALALTSGVALLARTVTVTMRSRARARAAAPDERR